MAQLNKQSSKQTNKRGYEHVENHAENEVVELMSKRYGGISFYTMVMVLLAVAIIASGVVAAMQVQKYHEGYKDLQKMKKEYLQLQIEHNRLQIEQQTFSATPQIAARAVAELNMYSPTLKDKMIIQPTAQKPTEAETNANTNTNMNNTNTNDGANTASVEQTGGDE